MWEEPSRVRPLALPVPPGIAEGMVAEELPCVVATVCERSELSVLCGFLTHNLDAWKPYGSSNFFVNEGEGGTFLAPVDGAFNDTSGVSILTDILVNDLADPSILLNVLLYHVAPIGNATTEDVLLALEDFDCSEDLVMANGLSTSTLCGSGGRIRYQYGSGNRPLRTLPKIMIEGIDACDASVVIHFVDKLILPGIPLKGMPTLENTVVEEKVKGSTPVAPVVEVGAETSLPEDTCPLDVPLLFSDCQNIGQSCDYGFFYDGCSWEYLKCTPTMTCTCVDTGPEGMTGSWTCVRKFNAPCKPQFTPEVVTIPADEEDDDLVVPFAAKTDVDLTRPPLDPNAFPQGACDPNLPLPTAPAATLECPARAPQSFADSCTGYPEKHTCNYGHIYMGCDWDELRCGWTQSCSCTSEGTWACAIASIAMCPQIVEFDKDTGRDVVVSPPEGLPWGAACDPDEELPGAPLPPIDENALEGRLSDECPSTYEFGSCAGYEPNLRCDYTYMYTGCTWDELSCIPLMSCTCDQFGFDGTWACMAMAMAPCPSTPEGHPFGKYCDPGAPLPLPPSPANTENADVLIGRSEAQKVSGLISGSWEDLP